MGGDIVQYQHAATAKKAVHNISLDIGQEQFRIMCCVVYAYQIGILLPSIPQIAVIECVFYNPVFQTLLVARLAPPRQACSRRTPCDIVRPCCRFTGAHTNRWRGERPRFIRASRSERLQQTIARRVRCRMVVASANEKNRERAGSVRSSRGGVNFDTLLRAFQSSPEPEF